MALINTVTNGISNANIDKLLLVIWQKMYLSSMFMDKPVIGMATKTVGGDSSTALVGKIGTGGGSSRVYNGGANIAAGVTNTNTSSRFRFIATWAVRYGFGFLSGPDLRAAKDPGALFDY